MNKTTIKEVGTINLDKIEVVDGQISIFIPVEVMDEKFNAILDDLLDDYRKKHPKANDICFEICLFLSFGLANPEFEINVTIFDGDYENTNEDMECYDGIMVELTEEQSKAVKQTVWNNLGKMFLNL